MPTPLPPLPPRLIGLDLDGTILDGRGELPEAVLEALRACRAAGIELGFLTGRRPNTTKLALMRYLDRAAVSTNSGCLLWQYPGWEPAGTVRLFPRELLADVVDALAPWSLNLYQHAGPDEAGRILLLRESTPEFEHAQHLYGLGNPVIHRIAELDALIGAEGGITQVALPSPRALAEELQARVVERFGAALLALVVRWPLVPCHALELFHPEAHKGSALAYFAQQLNIPREQVLAVGDDTNDLAMLHWAGFGVAMPHSEAEIRNAADAVLEGADGQLALAEYLQRLATLSR